MFWACDLSFQSCIKTIFKLLYYTRVSEQTAVQQLCYRRFCVWSISLKIRDVSLRSCTAAWEWPMNFCLLWAVHTVQKSVFSSHDAKQKSVSADDVGKMRRPLPAMLCHSLLLNVICSFVVFLLNNRLRRSDLGDSSKCVTMSTLVWMAYRWSSLWCFKNSLQAEHHLSDQHTWHQFYNNFHQDKSLKAG